jgi:hypothetical protein
MPINSKNTFRSLIKIPYSFPYDFKYQIDSLKSSHWILHDDHGGFAFDGPK